MSPPTSERSSTPAGIAARYAVGLASAYLLTVMAAALILIPLVSQASPEAAALLSARSLGLSALLVFVGTSVVILGALFNMSLARRTGKTSPDRRPFSAATRFMCLQSAVLFGTWVATVAVFVLLSVHETSTLFMPSLIGIGLGGVAATGLGLLLTQRTMRPILSNGIGTEGGGTAPSVAVRFALMWLVFSALPCGTTAALLLAKTHGWFIDRGSSIDLALLLVSVTVVVLGIPTMILVARSISDPVSEVIDAMAAVEKGQIETRVDVYEPSEIGRLQRGFNNMVTQVAERDRLRDLFGRHVGADVARRALENSATFSGDVREVAVLFIDIVDSTKLAQDQPPQAVASLLNEFFTIVVTTVEQHNGLVNKFAGDAILAVYGAPLPDAEAATSALVSARTLRENLRSDLPQVQSGIGVTAGSVFAGNIGSANRYEYTVIGDCVNEAARLADLAKESPERVLAAGSVIHGCSADERAGWTSVGAVTVRGRSESTPLWSLQVTSSTAEDDGQSDS